MLALSFLVNRENTGLKIFARMIDTIRMEKKGQSRKPRRRNETIKRVRKYLVTIGVGGLAGCMLMLSLFIAAGYDRSHSSVPAVNLVDDLN